MTEAAQAPEDDQIEIPDEDLDIVLNGPEDDIEPTPTASKPEAKLPDEPDEPDEKPRAVSADDGIAELKAQLDAEKRARAEDAAARKAAEEKIAEHEKKFGDQKNEHERSRYYQVVSALDAVEIKSANTRRDYAEAMRAGDYDKVAELQMAMAEQAPALAQLRQGKAQWEAYFKQPRQPEAKAQPQVSADPVEAMAAAIQANGSPRSADWIRKHPDYARDPNLELKMRKAHFSAIGEDLAPETDGYFAYIEKRLGLDEKKPATPPVERKAQPAAPTSRTAPNSGGKTSYTPTAAERRLCEETGQSLADYAKYKLILRKQGRLSSNV